MSGAIDLRAAPVPPTLIALLDGYRAGAYTVSEVATAAWARAAGTGRPVWISLVAEEDLRARAALLDAGDRSLPLYGIPFAVKDNIDVAGMQTTAGCPGFAYVAQESAAVVERLLEAGAILIGKTNLDQFATGLVGSRSPYGAPSSVYDPARISGGSSSGSAVAVALGEVTFALGTDTAGSGRVPAAFNGLVGLKPTRGLLSCRGVVPACASLDCVSIFAADVPGAALVIDVAAGYDPQDAWSRRIAPSTRPRRGIVALPQADQALPDDPAMVQAWQRARDRVTELWTGTTLDVSPLLDAAPLLYEIWIAERTASLREVIAGAPDGLDPTVAAIIAGGQSVSATDVFDAEHRLAALRRATERIWEQVDAMVLPTVPLHPTHAQVAADPVAVNSRLGAFTNFTNLLDLAAVAVPAGLTEAGLPFGVTLLGPAGEDARLLELAADWSGASGSAALDAAASQVGGPTVELAVAASQVGGPTVELAVAGAHMRGLPLNWQLSDRGGRFVRRCATAPMYRLYALDGSPPRPGLIRVAEGGSAIELEIWRLAPAALGELLTLIPAPLGLGQVELDDGQRAVGFICEGYAAATATEITAYGGWRSYLADGADRSINGSAGAVP